MPKTGIKKGLTVKVEENEGGIIKFLRENSPKLFNALSPLLLPRKQESENSPPPLSLKTSANGNEDKKEEKKEENILNSSVPEERNPVRYPTDEEKEYFDNDI